MTQPELDDLIMQWVNEIIAPVKPWLDAYERREVDAYLARLEATL